MTGPAPDIETALSGDGPISSEQVLSWIDAASDSDLPTLSKLYRLTGEGYYRIQPELGRGPTCALIQRYLLGCIRDGVNDNDEIQERYQAAETLHVWFRQLVGDTADYELAFVATPSTSAAVAQEAILLELYEADHGDLPPENKRR